MKRGLRIIIILLSMAVFMCGCIDVPKMETLSLSGTPVPVTFGWEEKPSGVDDGNYWVGTARISGDSTKYVLTLPAGESQDGATAQETIILQISGMDTKWVSSIEEDPTPIQYNDIDWDNPWWGLWLDHPYNTKKDTPYYNVVPVGQALHASADIKVSTPDSTIPHSATISNYDKNPTVVMNIKDSNGIMRKIYFKIQGVAFRGELPPSGDLSVLKKPDGNYILVSHDHIHDAVSSWNDYFEGEQYYTGYPFDQFDDWGDAYSWMAGQGKFPSRQPASTRMNIITGDDARVEIAYDTTVFAPDVTFYIHESLAHTVTIAEAAPEFRFDSIDDIEGVEGGSVRMQITGTAMGTGTIRLQVDSPAVKSANFVYGAAQDIVAGEEYSWPVDLEFNTALTADREFEASVKSIATGFGTSTSEEFKIYLTDKDTVLDSEKHNVRVYAIYATTGDKVAAAPLYVGYGSDKNIGYGDSTKTGVVEGTYQVYSENITGWYPAYTADHPKTINVESDVAVEILFTTDEPEYDDGGIFSMDLWLPIVGILIIVGYVVMMHGGGIRILEPLRPILSNPYFWMFMAVLVIGVVGWLIYQDMSAKADNFITAIEGIKLL